MTKETPIPGNPAGFPERNLEDDMCHLHGLAAAMEVCDDVIEGVMDPNLARRAMPSLIRLMRAELARVAEAELKRGAKQ